MQKPYSPACERNRDPILEVLKSIIPKGRCRLLEVGSGTGQHAVYFAPHFPDLTWTTSDVSERHPGTELWLRECNLPNVRGPIELEIGKNRIPPGEFDMVFSANVLHIVSLEKVHALIELLGDGLPESGEVVFYGPFNYGGQFTSQSNRDFDRHLKTQDPDSGIRDFEEITRLMAKEGFGLVFDYEMPANNRILHFRRGPA